MNFEEPRIVSLKNKFMDKSLNVEKTVFIEAAPMIVWEALTTTEIIKQYFFGTEASSDWVPGSDITFRGEWEGKSYVDKGHILEAEAGKKLKYDYWSGFSGLEDIPENYSMVTYLLFEEHDGTRLVLHQEGFSDPGAQAHADSGWEAVLENLRKVVEG